MLAFGHYCALDYTVLKAIANTWNTEYEWRLGVLTFMVMFMNSEDRLGDGELECDHCFRWNLNITLWLWCFAPGKLLDTGGL